MIISKIVWLETVHSVASIIVMATAVITVEDLAPQVQMIGHLRNFFLQLLEHHTASKSGLIFLTWFVQVSTN